MGQTHIGQDQMQTQRIRPTPGSSGRKNKKGMISVYCEDSCKIFTVNVNPAMKVSDFKRSLPDKNCQLWHDGKELNNDDLIESLIFDSNTVFRMVNRKMTSKSLSTMDSSHGDEGIKIFGPKKKDLEQPIQPNHESLISCGDDFSYGFNLKDFAVPDIVLNVVKKEKTVESRGK